MIGILAGVAVQLFIIGLAAIGVLFVLYVALCMRWADDDN